MNYKKSSPYAETPISTDGNYLEQYVTRNVPASFDDVVFEITNKYNLRPDLLAHDLYGDVNLWWIFSERNPNTLKDPVGDFKSGTIIFIPNSIQLISNLGL